MKTALAGMLAVAMFAAACGDGEQQLLLGVTTSVQDPGLLDELVDAFEDEYDYDVKPIAQGSGQILELARRGELDVIITHSPADEQRLIDDGFATERIPVVQNHFQVVGPPGDPAGVAGAASIPDAFARIGRAGAPFISRGDESGTHRRELAYWHEAAIDPAGEPWYSESAAGQGDTLNLANERNAYTLVDSSTFLSFQAHLVIELLLRDEETPNIYSLLRLDPDRLPEVHIDAGDAWFEFMTSEAGQGLIAEFGVEEYGETLFEPLQRFD